MRWIRKCGKMVTQEMREPSAPEKSAEIQTLEGDTVLQKRFGALLIGEKIKFNDLASYY